MKQYQYHIAPKKDKNRVQWLYIEAEYFEEEGYLPEGVWGYKNVEKLGIRGWIKKLPEDLYLKLPKLRKLSIAFASSDCLPSTIGQCKDLEIVWISVTDAPIQLPPSFSQLSKLKTLSLNKCKLAKIPPVITQLPALEELHLSENELRVSLKNDHYWSKLKMLFLGQNQFEQIPPWIYQHPSLDELDLFGNNIQQIDDAIEQLQQLICLKVSSNELQHLPTVLSKLPLLKVFNWSNNPCGWMHPVLFTLHESIFDPKLFRWDSSKKNAKTVVAIRKILTKKSISSDDPVVATLCTVLNQESNTDHLSNRAILDAYLLGHPKLRAACLAIICNRLKPFETANFVQGSEVLILGKTIKTKAVLNKKLKQLGIVVTAKKTPQTTHVIIGKNIKKTAALEDQTLIAVQENQLNSWLDKQAPDYLVQDSDDQQDNVYKIRDMLWSFDEDAVLVALQLMKGGGVPKGLITSLFAVYKFSPNSKIVRQSKNLLELNASPSLLEAMKKRFSLKKCSQGYWNIKRYLDPLCAETELDYLELVDFGYRSTQAEYPYTALYTEGFMKLIQDETQKRALAIAYWQLKTHRGTVRIQSGDPIVLKYLFEADLTREMHVSPAHFLHVQHPIASCSKLQTLHLSNEQDQLRLPHDFGQLPNLETLITLDIADIAPEALEQLQLLPALKTLSCQVDRFPLTKSWLQLGQIEHLSLGGCSLDLSILDLSGFPRLKTLHINSARNLTGAEQLFQQLQSSNSLEQVVLYQALDKAYQQWQT